MCAPLDHGDDDFLLLLFLLLLPLPLLSLARHRTRKTGSSDGHVFLDVLDGDGTREAIIRHLRLVSGMALLRGVFVSPGGGGGCRW
ncbi:hypothetical protein CGRA01v4_07218 [Colletotrichum graminicola]|nr:hypothetical protein CGRA01v4_07218 [Colletotrichum graminicola]